MSAEPSNPMPEINLESLTAKKQQLDQLKPLLTEVTRSLDEWLRIELTYASNAIEGNTLTRIETAEVLTRGVNAIISGKSLKDQLEAINHAKALDLIQQLATQRKGHQFIEERDILAIHQTILTGIDDNWAGKYRRSDVFVGGVDIVFPRPNEVPSKIEQFMFWLETRQEGHPVRIAADAHFKLVSIHPFVDGNGRTSRLLMNLVMLLNGYPLIIIRNEERVRYLEAVYRGQSTGAMTDFYALIEEATDRSLTAYINAASGDSPLEPLIPN